MALDDQPAPNARPGGAPVLHAADLELARRAQAGDESAFREFATRLACVPRYVAHWNRRASLGMDGDEIDDVCQDVLVLAWRKLHTFHGGATLESWAFGLALGQLKNAVRAKRRRLRRFVSGAPAEDAEPAAESVEPFALSAEDSALVRAVVEELPEEEARVVRGKHFDERTFEELARTQGISPNTVKSRYYRALVRLAVALRRWREEP